MNTARPTGGQAARWTLWLVLAAAFALMLRLNLPGHLSVDSVLALHEGRFGVRETWNPAIFGWLLGVSDRLHPGAAGVVILSGLMLFGGLAGLAALRPRTSWWAPVLAVGIAALPQLMIYPAIVWKDVLFAGAALAAFAVAGRGLTDAAGRTPWASLALSALLLAAAGLFRQNGLILALPLAAAIIWTSRKAGWGRALAFGTAWFAAVLALTLALSALARPQGPGLPDDAGQRGVRILQIYDIVGAAAIRPDRPTPRIDAESPAAGAYIRSAGGRLYSPERVDTLSQDARFGELAAPLSAGTIRAEWLHLVATDPGLYLKTRLTTFGQVFATPVIDACLPIHIGVGGPAATLQALDMAPRVSPADQRLYNYATWFFDTPAMSHVAFAVLALIILALLVLRRDQADWVMVALLTGALGFAASFFVISIACDYRYLYFLDVAALAGLLYWAADPRLRPRSLV